MQIVVPPRAPPLPPAPTLQLLPQVSRKPPPLQLHGHRRLWGWLLPVFRVSDEELVRSAGLDALIGVSGGDCSDACLSTCSEARWIRREGLLRGAEGAASASGWGRVPGSSASQRAGKPVACAAAASILQVRIISFGVILFLPMTVVGLAVLLPINYTSGGGFGVACCGLVWGSAVRSLCWPAGRPRLPAELAPARLPSIQWDSSGPYKILQTSFALCLPDYYKQYAEQEGMDEYSSVFMRMTISNIRQRSPLLWYAS